MNQPFQFRSYEFNCELVEFYVGMEPKDIKDFREQYEKHIAHPDFAHLRELEGKSDDNVDKENGEDEPEQHTGWY